VHDHGALKFCKAISSTYDENSTYQKIITQIERKMRILEHHFLKEITVEKAPREIPPPLPPSFPSCESPTTCKDETYKRSRRPSYRIRRQMARRKRTSQQIIFNTIRRKGEQEKDDLLGYVPNKHPNTYPRKFIQNRL